MARIYLTGGRTEEVSQDDAKRISAMKKNIKQYPPATTITLDSGYQTELSQIKGVDPRGGEINIERYDIFRDRVFLEQFGKMLSSFGGDKSLSGQFKEYCLANRYIFPSGSVNADTTQQYSDECEKFSALRRLEDLKNEKNESLEAIEFGQDFVPSNASSKAIDEMIIGLERYIKSRKVAGSANKILDNLRRKQGKNHSLIPSA